MGRLIIVAGTIQIIGGFAVLAGSKSEIHEILGALGVGMGVLSFALGFANNHLASIRKLKTVAEKGYVAPSEPGL